jgi:AcrR family transcriptional regulator
MAYRQTDKTRTHKEEIRQRILKVTRDAVADGGFTAVHMSSVAIAAGLATGTLYRHFPSRGDLLADVFRLVTQREVEVMAEVTASDGLASERLAGAIETFARRAMRAPGLAYALIFEPVDPLVDTERLVFRRSYAEILAGVIGKGIASGEFPSQNTDVVANCVVGALAEALVGPLATGQTQNPEETAQTIVTFCLNAVMHSPTSEVTT